MLMSRVVLFGVFFIGSTALSNATPLDSPDTVYVDGTPCNSACQSYLAWSRQILSGRAAQSPPDVADQRKAGTIRAKPKSAAHVRAARQAAPAAGRTRQDKIARLHQPNMSGIPAPVRKPADAASRAAPNPVAPSPVAPSPVTPTSVTPNAAPSAVNPSSANPSSVNPSAVDPSAVDPSAVDPGAVNKPDEQTAGLQQQDVATPPSSTGAAVAVETPKKTEAPKKTRAVQDQVIAATALAEQLTSSAAARPELRAMNREPRNDGATIPTDANVAASPTVSDASVALVMSRPEINSVTDLAGKNVAMDSARSGSANDVRTALVAAGAAEVQVNTGETSAVERLVNGDVPAAVLTLVSPDAAEAFPEIAGFRVFRIPLSPGALQARPDTP
jgi:hypothetical protein